MFPPDVVPPKAGFPFFIPPDRNLRVLTPATYAVPTLKHRSRSPQRPLIAPAVTTGHAQVRPAVVFEMQGSIHASLRRASVLRDIGELKTEVQGLHDAIAGKRSHLDRQDYRQERLSQKVVVAKQLHQHLTQTWARKHKYYDYCAPFEVLVSKTRFVEQNHRGIETSTLETDRNTGTVSAPSQLRM